MILLEDIPRSGVFIVSAYFKGYKDYYQNESRKDLKEKLPKRLEDEGLDVTLEPLQFSLIRHVDETGRSRSIGVTYFYRFKDMKPEEYRELHKLAQHFLENNAKWSHHQILVGSRVGGLENGE
ncbi:MAG: hypothetical protein ACE5KV_07125 [Thermoplasmata archaeon]